MGINKGALKYFVYTLLSGTGFVCMYLFGGVVITFFSTLNHLFAGNFIEAFIEYYITSALPPTSVGQVIGTAILGAGVAAVKWAIAMVIYRAYH